MPKPVHAVEGFVLALLLGFAAIAQSPGDTRPSTDGLTAPEIESKLAELAEDTSLDATTKAAATDLHRAALEQIQRAGEFTARTAEFRRLTAEAPQLLVTIRAELAKPPVEAVVSAPAGATLQQLEQSISLASAELLAARQSTADLLAEAGRRDERRLALPEQIARLRQQLADSEDPDTILPREGEAVALTAARRTAQRAKRLALLREIESDEAETASYDARRDLLPARRDRAQRRVADSEKLVAAWQTLVTAQRQTEAQQAAQVAQRQRRDAARQDPVLRKYAEDTAAMARARTGANSIAERIDAASRDAADSRSKLAALRAHFAAIQRRLEASGLNRATGMLLRRQYESLPDVAALHRGARVSQQALENTEYHLVELQEDRLDAGDTDRVAQNLIAQLPESGTITGQAELEQVARELATARRDLLDQLIADATTYFDKLVELNTTQHESLEVATSYRDFIEERILWVRSVAGDRWPRPADMRDAALWLFNPPGWEHANSSLRRYILARGLLLSSLVVSLLALWLIGVRNRKRLVTLGELVSRYRTDAYRHTIEATILTIMLAAPPAIALYAAGWLLAQPDDQAEVAVAMGFGLRSAAITLFPLLLLRQTLRAGGLAEAHFRWSRTTIQPLRRNLRWFTPTAVPIAGLVSALDHSGNEADNASLGRVLYTIGLIALAIFLQRILRPRGPTLRGFLEANKSGWMHRLRFIWFPMVVLSPLVFVTLSWLGFHYTALQLGLRLEQSLMLVLVLVLADGLMLRWLLIARRRIAVEEARRRREQAAADAQARQATGGAATGAPESSTPAFDEDKIDLPALSEQTRQLFHAAITVAVVVGLFIIWAEALPALRRLDRVQVWPSITIIEGDTLPTADANGGSAAPGGPTAQPTGSNGGALPMAPVTQALSSAPEEATQPALSVTLADLGYAVIVLFVTWIAFRNIPSLVEIVVLQRLPLDAGSRYAMSTVLRYTIAIIGVMIAFNALGLTWNKVQWLAAALTFGLAFGLQEIFANFVSGLIILAERPIRIGDTVTVGQVTGTVTRIRMRATTIADWDRKELVIPNKTFITGEVINWSLSDPILRVVIPVGVSYSSDAEKVKSLLLKVADKHPVVLNDPRATVSFRSFGDSTLDFELRVFIPHIDYLQSARDELHHAILKAFRKAGIEIAFPQRDLHIRSAEGLGELVQRRKELAASELDDPAV
jgi:potassium efflux system protein